MAAPSVKVAQLGSDSHLLTQSAGKHPALGRTVEARDAPAGVGAAAGLSPPGDENAFAGCEAEQIALRRRPAAAGTAPLRLAPYDCSSAGTSSSAST